MAFTEEQLSNASIIIQVGRSMGMSNRDIQIGLMTAFQESGMRNLKYGDRDSQGLFQQRPSQGWGSVAQVTDPDYAARKFFSALQQVKGRDSMALTKAAQAVQRSAFPNAYAKWENEASKLLQQLGGGESIDAAPGQAAGGDLQTLSQAPKDATGDALTDVSAEAPGMAAAGEVATAGLEQPTLVDDQGEVNMLNAARNVDQMLEVEFDPKTSTSVEVDGQAAPAGGSLGAASPQADKIISYARKALGTPYVWGGNSLSGLDCSGLIQQAFAAAGIDMPRVSFEQANKGQRVALNKLRPGDLVAWDNSSRNRGADHIAIYIGDGKIIEAPRPGRSVQVNTIYDKGRAWGVRILD